MDRFGPYKYFLLVCDVFSHLVFTRALPNKTAETVRKAFQSILKAQNLKFGEPSVLQTDKGGERTFKLLCTPANS